jgi:XTP/dITP diphosphohydrolase
VEGEILATPRGDLGFGYDSLFLFPPLRKTFAELDDAEKFGVSARGQAFRRLLDWLSQAPL